MYLLISVKITSKRNYMKIGIIAAMEQELVLLVEQLENKVEKNCFRQYLLYRTIG